MDDLSREKEARIAAEKLQSSLTDDLEKVRQEQLTSSQKVGCCKTLKLLQDDLFCLDHQLIQDEC